MLDSNLHPKLFAESKDSLLLRTRSVYDASELCLLAWLLMSLFFTALELSLSLLVSGNREFVSLCMVAVVRDSGLAQSAAIIDG